MKFSKLVSLLGVTTLLSGCVATQNHDLRDISHVERGNARALEQGAAEVKAVNRLVRTNGVRDDYQIGYPAGSQNSLSYAESKQLANAYAGVLPKVSVNLYFAREDIAAGTNRAYSSYMGQPVNLTGPINTYLDEVKAVQDQMARAGASYTFLDVGNADKDFASAKATDNQFSREKGISGVEFYSTNPTNKFAGYAAHEAANGDVTVVFDFGKSDFSGKFSRNIAPAVGVLGLEAGTAYGVLRGAINHSAGLAGAAGLGAAELVDFTVGYVEGRRAPRGTTMVQRRETINIGLEDKVSGTLQVFDRAKQLGATDIAFFEDKDGLGIVYGNNFRSVSSDGKTLTVVVDHEGAMNWKAFALGIAKGAAGAGAAYGVYDWTFDKPQTRPTGTGGRIDEGSSVTHPGHGSSGTGRRTGAGTSVRGN